jgi:hypothetical protein
MGGGDRVDTMSLLGFDGTLNDSNLQSGRDYG